LVRALAQLDNLVVVAVLDGPPELVQRMLQRQRPLRSDRGLVDDDQPERARLVAVVDRGELDRVAVDVGAGLDAHDVPFSMELRWGCARPRAGAEEQRGQAVK